MWSQYMNITPSPHQLNYYTAICVEMLVSLYLIFWCLQIHAVLWMWINVFCFMYWRENISVRDELIFLQSQTSSHKQPYCQKLNICIYIRGICLPLADTWRTICISSLCSFFSGCTVAQFLSLELLRLLYMLHFLNWGQLKWSNLNCTELNWLALNWI